MVGKSHSSIRRVLVFEKSPIDEVIEKTEWLHEFSGQSHPARCQNIGYEKGSLQNIKLSSNLQ